MLFHFVFRRILELPKLRIEILKNTSIKGAPVQIGRVLNVDKIDAQILIGYGLAKPYIETIKIETGGHKGVAPKPQNLKKGKK